MQLEILLRASLSKLTNVEHKVTLFVVDHGDEYDGLAQLQGDMYHNSGSRIVEIQTAEFDREWSDDDPLNKTTTMDDRALLESLVKGGQKTKRRLSMMEYNVCKTCGACDGRCGLMIGEECLNCHKTRETGNFVLHAELERTPEEMAKTGAILE